MLLGLKRDIVCCVILLLSLVDTLGCSRCREILVVGNLHGMRHHVHTYGRELLLPKVVLELAILKLSLLVWIKP